jgi:hypothetical protein
MIDDVLSDKYNDRDEKGDWMPAVKILGADSVTFKADALVCWTPDRSVARSFAGGGGLSSSAVRRKAILSFRNVIAHRIAFYWPAIYAHLGNSVDTKEVWIYNPSGTMTVSKEDFERLK